MRFPSCPCAVPWFGKDSQVAAIVWEFLKEGVLRGNFLQKVASPAKPFFMATVKPIVRFEPLADRSRKNVPS
jgi:hypothetical protein